MLTPVGAQMGVSDTDPPPASAPPANAPLPGGCPPGVICGDCNACGECMTSCKCRCPLKYGVFGEFLYLRARNAEVAYAVDTNGIIGGPPNQGVYMVPTSRHATVEPTSRAGFRGGVTYYLDDCVSTITASYTRFESMNADTLGPSQPPGTIQSLVVPLGSLNAAQTWQLSTASESVDFQFIDIDYKTPIFWTDCFTLNFLAGGRYAKLNQEFIANNSINGEDQIRSNVDFEGGGIRLGLDANAEARGGVFGYAKGNMSLLGGVSRADYQLENLNPGVGLIADTSLRAARVVTILETELGLGWHSRNNNLRLSAGYMFNTWHNVLKVQEYINSVRYSNPTDPSGNYNGMLTFDGFVGRVEGNW